MDSRVSKQMPKVNNNLYNSHLLSSVPHSPSFIRKNCQRLKI